jgi:hypothetical protein
MMDAKVLIEVSGGVVVAAYSNDPRLRVLLLDWDEQGDGVIKNPVGADDYPVDKFDAMPADTAELFLKAIKSQNDEGQ